MQIEIMSPDQLKPYDKNPRINDDAIVSVAKSIEKFGFNQPLVCDQNNIICVGHTRWKAAIKLGLKTIPVYKRKMSEKEFIAYNIADNRTSENAKWDDTLLADLMKELDGMDSKFLEYTGFTDAELEGLLEDDDNIDEMIEDDTTKKKEKVIDNKSHVRMVQLFFNDESFPLFIERCEALQKVLGTSNLTDTVFKVIENASNKTH